MTRHAQQRNKTMTPEQEAELRRYRGWFPFRICFAAKHPETGAVEIFADTTKRRWLKLARQGYSIYA